MSSFCGTCLLSGGTTLKPKNINTLINAVLSGLFLLKQTYTFSHSNLSSANSSNETKLSRDPSISTLVGMSTYNTPLTSNVFHSTSFSSLNEHLKLTNNESGLSAISSKSINSDEWWLEFSFMLQLDSLETFVDDDEDDEDDCFLWLWWWFRLLLRCGLINLLKLPTLPLIMPPSEPTHSSCWSSCGWSSAVFLFTVAAWAKSGIILRPCSETNT